MTNQACLRLFNAVLENGTFAQAPVFLPDFGVIVSPQAAYAAADISEYLHNCSLDGKQLNATFHKSWKKVATASNLQLRLEQVLHYLTTYGLEAIGLYSQDTIYIPGEVLQVPEKLTLKTITAISVESAKQQCLDLLAQKVALGSETISDVLVVLKNCGYQFTGKEIIGNREAFCLISDLRGVLPRDGDQLFRYLIYKATGSALVIKNKVAYANIQSSGFQLPIFDTAQQIELAKSFNRYKPLWMSFKKSSPKNPRSVNAIARLSKKHHVPIAPNPLSSVTAGNYSIEHVTAYAKTAPLPQVIRAINALRSYAITDARRYRIRNGKSWVKSDRDSMRKIDQSLAEALLSIVRQRIGRDQVYYVPPHVDYALPISEKQFIGNVPIGTTISIPQSKESLLVGVHWFDGESRNDLDLSCLCINRTVISWNSHLRSSDRQLLYSGDVTAAPRPQGAAEYLYASEITSPWLVSLNPFSGDDEVPFSFRIATAGNIDEDAYNYIVDPNKVIFEVPMKIAGNQMVLGLLEPSRSGIGSQFTLLGDIGSSCRVADHSDRSLQRLSASLAQSASLVRLSEVVRITHDPRNADIDLSVANLQRNTLLRLVS